VLPKLAVRHENHLRNYEIYNYGTVFLRTFTTMIDTVYNCYNDYNYTG